MRVYFLSERPAWLTVNGLFLGGIDGHERSVELRPADALFCECTAPGCVPFGFLFDEAFLLSPPEGVTLYYPRGGVAVFLHGFVRADASLKPIWQKRLSDTVLTLYLQGRLQLSLQNGTGLHIVDLPDRFEEASVRAAGDMFLLETPASFCILAHDGTVVTVSDGTVSETEPSVVAEVRFHDALGHRAECAWEDGKLVRCKILASQKPTDSTYALALFESLLIGADVAPFLSEALAEQAQTLREYLGDFRFVALTDREGEVGLGYERRPRVFDLRYFRTETDADGRICNLRPSE